MDKDPRFEVENEKMQETLRNLAALIQMEILPDGWGFALFLFEFKGQAFFWISNADRADMVKALREFIKKEEPN